MGKKLKVLITGGAGFIGTNLIQLLNKIDKKISINIIDNESIGKKKDIKGLINKYYKLDLSKDITYRKIDKNYDAIIHLAGQTRVIDSIDSPELTIQNNVIGTFKLFDFARKNKIYKIISASTGGAIDGDYKKIIDELTLPKPISPYGVSKLFIESLAFSYNETFGMKSTCLRFSNVYGPGCQRKESVVSVFIKKIIKKQTLIVYGEGKQKRDFIYVEDVAMGIYKALRSHNHGVYQLSTGESTSINQLLKILNNTVLDTHQFRVKYVKKRKGEIFETLISNNKAKSKINFKVNTKLDEGIKTTWEWLIANQNYI